MSDDWGPWIEHDGNGCPCVGEWVHVLFDHKSLREASSTMTLIADGWEAVGTPFGGASWYSTKSIACHVIRYRIRRPRGMAILNAILTNLPAPVKQYEVMK